MSVKKCVEKSKTIKKRKKEKKTKGHSSRSIFHDFRLEWQSRVTRSRSMLLSYFQIKYNSIFINLYLCNFLLLLLPPPFIYVILVCLLISNKITIQEQFMNNRKRHDYLFFSLSRSFFLYIYSKVSVTYVHTYIQQVATFS